jgi:DNA-binding NtrC family response regulator
VPVTAAAKPTVLLVDDDVELLHAVARNLNHLPVRLETRGSAEDALAWLEQGGAPAMIIANQWRGGMTGQSLLEWVRVHRPGVSCVLHTGDAGQRGGADVVVIVKPTQPGILRNLVATVCS